MNNLLHLNLNSGMKSKAITYTISNALNGGWLQVEVGDSSFMSSTDPLGKMLSDILNH